MASLSLEGMAPTASPLAPPPAAPTSSGQGLGRRRSGPQLPSPQGPEGPRLHPQMGLSVEIQSLPPKECSFSPKRPGRLADALCMGHASPAGEGRVEGLEFHFLRNSRFSSCGCYRRRQSTAAGFLWAFIATQRARAIRSCSAAKDSPSLARVT